MRRAALLAGALILAPCVAQAATEQPEALRTYVQARMAASAGATGEASRSYAAALAAAPGSGTLAANALTWAISSGDRALAVRAASRLAAAGDASPEVRLTLLGEALRTRDWRGANAQIDAIAADEVFAFMAPILRAWVAQGSGRGDPIAILGAAGAQGPVQLYVPEQRALLQLLRQRRGGAEAFTAYAAQSETRALRMRLAGAALLARRGNRGNRGDALALLAGAGEPLARARDVVQQRRPLRGEISTANAGVAEFLVRLALDLNAQEVRPLALSFARLATFLAPENSETWLIAAELLAAQGNHVAALAALGNVPADDPFAGNALDLRVRSLIEAGRGAEAVAAALQATQVPTARLSDWIRLGDTQVALERHREAGEAYSRALALAGEGTAETPLWALNLLLGGALEKAGDWSGGKAALQRAHVLAPREPLVLNYLGYAQLERRENIEAALALVAEAHRLAPDNGSIADSLGWGYYLTGDFPRAVELLERAARAEPADVTINEHLGDAYFRAGRRLEARYAWKAASVYAEGDDAVRLRAKIDAGLTPQLAAR
jgi:tetratricopeptide (TPR) repeat protein